MQILVILIVSVAEALPCPVRNLFANLLRNVKSILKDSLYLLTSVSDKTSFGTDLSAIKAYPATSESWNPAEYMSLDNASTTSCWKGIFAAQQET